MPDPRKPADEPEKRKPQRLLEEPPAPDPDAPETQRDGAARKAAETGVNAAFLKRSG